MQENEVQERNVHWIKRYEIGLSLYTVILATVMIGIVLRIYLTGTSASNLSEEGLYLQPVYSRELVAGYLRSLLPWFLIWGVAAIVGGILHSRMPARKDFVPVSPEEMFERLVCKYEFTESDETRSAAESLMQEQKKWYYVNLVCVFICGLCLGVAGSYLLNREHFTSWDLELVMGAMLRAVLPPLVVAFAALCARSEWKKKSLERMIPQLRTIVAADAKTRLSQKKVVGSGNLKDFGLPGVRTSDFLAEKIEKAAPDSKSESKLQAKGKSESSGSIETFLGFSRLTISRLVIAVVAVVFLAVGVNNGGMRDVLVKAINICTECIGLG